MQNLIQHILSYLTGGMADFCPLFKVDETHCLIKLGMIRIFWHGVDIWPVVYGASFLCALLAAACVIFAIVKICRRQSVWLGYYLAAIFLATAAYAASSTLANLSAGSSVAGTDLFYDVQTAGVGGVKVTAAQIAAYVAGSGTSGIVTSIATGCQATGGTITTTGTISTQTVITDLSGSNPSITTGYCGGLENLDNSSAQTPTIAVSGSAGFPQSWYTDLCNINTGAQTLTPASGTIGGASTYVLAAGTKATPKCVRIISDAANTNYVLAFPPGSGGSSTITAGTTATSGITSGDLIGSSSNLVVDTAVAYANLGLLNGANAWTGNESHLGTELFTGTTTPTLAAGEVAISGEITAPTMSSNGEGILYLTSTTGGLTLQGKGSSTDLIFANSAGTAVCSIATGGVILKCASVNLNGGNLLSTGCVTGSVTNCATGSSNTLTVGQGGNVTSGATPAGGVTISASNSTSTTGGANGGNISIQAGNFTAASGGNTAGSVTITAGTATGGSGTAGTIAVNSTTSESCSSGLQTNSGGVLSCIVSAMRFKSPLGKISIKEGLDFVANADPAIFEYKNEKQYGEGQKSGLYADEVCKLSERLCQRDTEGKVLSYDERGVIALVIRAQQASLLDRIEWQFGLLRH